MPNRLLGDESQDGANVKGRSEWIHGAALCLPETLLRPWPRSVVGPGGADVIVWSCLLLLLTPLRGFHTSRIRPSHTQQSSHTDQETRDTHRETQDEHNTRIRETQAGESVFASALSSFGLPCVQRCSSAWSTPHPSGGVQRLVVCTCWFSLCSLTCFSAFFFLLSVLSLCSVVPLLVCVACVRSFLFLVLSFSDAFLPVRLSDSLGIPLDEFFRCCFFFFFDLPDNSLAYSLFFRIPSVSVWQLVLPASSLRSVCVFFSSDVVRSSSLL
jgi:hypothetical protein